MLERIVSVVGITAALAGCSAAGTLFGGGDAGQPAPLETPSTSALRIDAQGLAVYLEIMDVLIQGDPVVQADVFQDVFEAAQLAPTTTNRLKLALALATPGHPGSDALEAQRLLSDLLASGDALLSEERILATIHLKEAEQRLILNTEAEQLRRETDATLAEQSAVNTQRLEAALAENQRLREELQEAQEKLDAITNIELSISEDRDNGTEQE